MRFSGTNARAFTTMALVAAGNGAAWGVALLMFWGHADLLELAGIAYLLGLAHALDADHICAIDNVTRKLMQEGRRPLLVGFYFSLGHSTVVLLLTIAIALGATTVQSHFGRLATSGGLLGTLISALFLFVIAGLNVLVLRSVVITFNRIR